MPTLKVIPVQAFNDNYIWTLVKDGNAAVVDPALRVRGIGNLRVIDSSICPTIPASNTNIAAIAIGEKGADLLLAAAMA